MECQKNEELLEDEELAALREAALATLKARANKKPEIQDVQPIHKVVSAAGIHHSNLNQEPHYSVFTNSNNRRGRRDDNLSRRDRLSRAYPKGNSRSNLIVITPVDKDNEKATEKIFAPHLILPQHKWFQPETEDSSSPKTYRKTGPTRFNRHESSSDSDDSEYDASDDSYSNDTILQDEPQAFLNQPTNDNSLPDAIETMPSELELNFHNQESDLTVCENIEESLNGINSIKSTGSNEFSEHSSDEKIIDDSPIYKLQSVFKPHSNLFDVLANENKVDASVPDYCKTKINLPTNLLNRNNNAINTNEESSLISFKSNHSKKISETVHFLNTNCQSDAKSDNVRLLSNDLRLQLKKNVQDADFIKTCVPDKNTTNKLGDSSLENQNQEDKKVLTESSQVDNKEFQKLNHNKHSPISFKPNSPKEDRFSRHTKRPHNWSSDSNSDSCSPSPTREKTSSKLKSFSINHSQYPDKRFRNTSKIYKTSQSRSDSRTTLNKHQSSLYERKRKQSLSPEYSGAKNRSNNFTQDRKSVNVKQRLGKLTNHKSIETRSIDVSVNKDRQFKFSKDSPSKGRESKRDSDKSEIQDGTRQSSTYNYAHKRDRSSSVSSQSSTSSSSSSRPLPTISSVVKSVQSDVKMLSTEGNNSKFRSYNDYHHGKALSPSKTLFETQGSETTKRVPVHMRLGISPRNKVLKMTKDVEAAFLNSSSDEDNTGNSKYKKENFRVTAELHKGRESDVSKRTIQRSDTRIANELADHQMKSLR